LNLYLALPLVQVALSLILIPIVLKGHLRSAAHRLFAFYLLGLMVWGTLIFLMRSSPTLEQAYFWDRWLVGTGTLLAVIFYHFSVRFGGINIKKWFLPLCYTACLIFYLLSNMRLIIAGMQVKPYGYAPIVGPLLLPTMLLGYAIMIMSIINLMKVAKTAPYTEERNRSVYIIIGLVVSIVGAIFDFLPLLGLPLYPGAIIGNIIFCILTTAAIIKYHLLEINLIFRKGIAYLLISAFVAIPFVGIILLFNRLFGGMIPAWSYLILLILLAIILQPLWSRVQRLVDRWFYRERYDFLRELDLFSQETHEISDFEQLGSSLVRLISRALQTSNVHLLLRSESGNFTVVSSVGNDTTNLILKSYSPLLRWLQSSTGLLYHHDTEIVPHLQSLSAKEKNEFKDIGVELFVPLKTKKNELVGLLLLGRKLSQQLYSEEDMRLIINVANQVTVELENASLYENEKIIRKKLEEQDKMKTEFLNSVAHELNTPLTAILSSSELLDEEQRIVPAVKSKLIKNIRESASIMSRRVKELLDLARTQVGELKIETEPVDIADVVTKAASQVRILFERKKQKLITEAPEGLPGVEADRDKLQQVVFNLLSNANKFSPDGSEISIRVKKAGAEIVVEVEDTAPPLNDEEKEKLFEPYYRGDDVVERELVPGLGLGLTITKKIVELHHGRIWVENKPESGNIFAFSIPILK
jgi:signal transduction histidine kinase